MNLNDRVVVNRLNKAGQVIGFLGRGRRLLLIKMDGGGMAAVRDTDCKLLAKEENNE